MSKKLLKTSPEKLHWQLLLSSLKSTLFFQNALLAPFSLNLRWACLDHNLTFFHRPVTAHAWFPAVATSVEVQQADGLVRSLGFSFFSKHLSLVFVAAYSHNFCTSRQKMFISVPNLLKITHRL